MQDILEADNHHTAAVAMRINASKVKVMSALILEERCQDILLDGESFEYVQSVRSPKSSETGVISPVPPCL